MELRQINQHLKALVEAIPQLSDTDKFNLSQRCRNLVIRCGENPDEAADTENVAELEAANKAIKSLDGELFELKTRIGKHIDGSELIETLAT